MCLVFELALVGDGGVLGGDVAPEDARRLADPLVGDTLDVEPALELGEQRRAAEVAAARVVAGEDPEKLRLERPDVGQPLAESPGEKSDPGELRKVGAGRCNAIGSDDRLAALCLALPRSVVRLTELLDLRA